jgi:hypothetical protein
MLDDSFDIDSFFGNFVAETSPITNLQQKYELSYINKLVTTNNKLHDVSVVKDLSKSEL